MEEAIKIDKLAHKLKDRRLAEVLVAAGFTNPRSIRDASDGELVRLPGVGKAGCRAIRRRIARAGKRRAG